MTLRSTEVSWLSTESGFGPTQRFNELGVIFANRPTSPITSSRMAPSRRKIGDNGGQRHRVVLARHHAVGSRASGAAGTSGAVTGGVLSFGQIGAPSSPAVFSLLLGLFGGYSAGWQRQASQQLRGNQHPQGSRQSCHSPHARHRPPAILTSPSNARRGEFRLRAVR